MKEDDDTWEEERYRRVQEPGRVIASFAQLAIIRRQEAMNKSQPSVADTLVPNLSAALGELRRRVSKTKLVLQCRLVKLPNQHADLVSFLATFTYDIAFEAQNYNPTPSQRIDAVTLDLHELLLELDDIEKMPKISKNLASKVAEKDAVSSPP